MTKRRDKGEGSVYRRKDGRCVGEYEDANGKRRYVSGKTKTEVKAKLRKLLADRDEGIAYDSENLTVGGYLDRWLEAAKGSVRDRTWERHEQVVRLHLKPTIGDVKLDTLHAFYVLAVTTGMRNGELLGLQWMDVDLEARTLQVHRTVFNGVVSPPKRAAGNRTIRLTGLAVAALKEHRLAAVKQRISELVFPSRRGTPLSVHNVHNRSWKPLLKRAGLPVSTRMHDLRHTCATLLLGRGIPVKMVSEMLGHASVAI